MNLTRDHIGRWLERHGVDRNKRTGPVSMIVTDSRPEKIELRSNDTVIAAQPARSDDVVLAQVPVWVEDDQGRPAFDTDAQEFINDTVTLPFDIDVELLDDFDAWLSHGIEQGWVSEGHCDTHDRMPVTDEEEAAFDEGGDPCIPVLRVWGAEGRMSGDGS